MARIITITSGKGGVGKTSLSLNLSLSLAEKGLKVCLFDADLGLANVNILTGVYPEQNLESVIFGQCGLDDIMIKNYKGIDMIPGSSGVDKIADLTPDQTANLIHTFLTLDDYDYFIFDTSAGVSSQVLAFCMASHEIILVATTEPTSLTDAYALLKILSKHGYKNPIKVVLNQIKSGKLAQKAYFKLKKTVDQFLSVNLEPLGIIIQDTNVRKAVVAQTPVVKMFPNSIVSKCIRSISGKLSHKPGSAEDVSIGVFWEKCLVFIEANRPRKSALEKSQQTLENEALVRIENQLAFLTKELGSFKRLFNTHTLVPKPVPVNGNRSGKTPLDFHKYKKRQQHDQIPTQVVTEADKENKPIARGKLRSPTDDELKNWNAEPVIKVAKKYREQVL